MDYPIWQLTTFGGGFWVAFIATVHVFVAQFAIGGGLFLVLTEHMGYRRNNPRIIEYGQKHTLFFLLLTMVFGAVTGVGIWFTVALLSPQATITLIHNFVFGWAAEWVCFTGEIVALLVYYYGWDRLTKRQHLAAGWLYFIFGWLSLFLINGIIGFMLTPGEWSETGKFFDGFFNPTFWPSLAFRTMLCLMLAGLYGFLTATRIKHDETRRLMVRTCAAWTVLPFGLLLLAGWWYVSALPEPQYTLFVAKSHRIAWFMRWFWILGPFVALGGLLLAAIKPRKAGFAVALVVLVAALGWTGTFESSREAARKPYLIWGHTYSNSIRVDQVDEINANGALVTARWAGQVKDMADPADAGSFLFQLECSACHSIAGPMNDIMERTAKFTLTGMDSMLSGLGKINTYMPPFLGTDNERMLLARYIVEELHGRTETPKAEITPVAPLDIPPFNPAAPENGGDAYVLTAWVDKGCYCYMDTASRAILLPPGVVIKAQLVLRGDSPEVVTDGVTIHYTTEPAFQNPSKHTEFWKYAQATYGLDQPLEPDTGLGGAKTVGVMKAGDDGVFKVAGVPLVPYPNDGGFQPFPSVLIEARDADGNLLASTITVASISTEMGCKTCHGGEWTVDGLAGVADSTVDDVLAVHDRMNGTSLTRQVANGRPVKCMDCHADHVQESDGREGIPNLSAAVHGLHANHLSGRGAEVCGYCHPVNPEGATAAFRGRHADIVECTDCHGFIEDHALSLLKFEKDRGIKGVDKLMKHLKARTVGSVEEINAREPWNMAPDCLGCHKDFADPGTNAFNEWTQSGPELFRTRKDDMDAMPCISCHNSPHAVWPANNQYEADRDNVPPLQYQKMAETMGTQQSDHGCVCHTIAMEDSAHHENMTR